MKQTSAIVRVLGSNSRAWKGFFKQPPTIGNNFYLLADDMYDDDNYLTTVEVTSVKEIRGGGYIFSTADGNEFEVQFTQKPYSNKAGMA